ncbi:MAG: MATE family efflux transporter [Myxococcota bacterium]
MQHSNTTNTSTQGNGKQQPYNPYIQDPGTAADAWWQVEPVLAKRIVSLGIPAIVGMVTQTAINTVDLMMIGRLPGQLAIAGSSAVLSAVILLWAFGGALAAIAIGTQAVAARRFSEHRFEAAGGVLTNSLAVSAVASAVLIVVALQALPTLMQWMVASPTTRQLAHSYSAIRLLALPSMALTASYQGFYNGMGRMRVHMSVAVISSVLNLFLDWVLIFGRCAGDLCVPALGVDGAAWGSMISSYAGCLCMFLWSMQAKERRVFCVYRLSNLSQHKAFKVARLSFWSGLATMVIMTGFAMFAAIAGRVDLMQQTKDLNGSATSLITHIMMVIFIGCLAFGSATATLVSQSIGAGKPSLASRYGRQSALLAFYAAIVLGGAVFLFPRWTLQLFFHSEPGQLVSIAKQAVIEQAVVPLRLAAAIMAPVGAVALVLIQALYGAGKARFVMAIEFTLHFGCLVPLAWLLAITFNMGLLGCWLAATCYAVALFCATAWSFYRGSWKHVKI